MCIHREKRPPCHAGRTSLCKI